MLPARRRTATRAVPPNHHPQRGGSRRTSLISTLLIGSQGTRTCGHSFPSLPLPIPNRSIAVLVLIHRAWRQRRFLAISSGRVPTIGRTRITRPVAVVLVDVMLPVGHTGIPVIDGPGVCSIVARSHRLRRALRTRRL